MKTSNHQKYTTKNPLKRLCINNFQKNLVNMVGDTNALSVLDVGCGEGFNTKLFRDMLPGRICGIDLNKVALEVAMKSVPDVEFKEGNIYDLPFHDNEFELVNCNEVLEHIDEPIKALKELTRVSSNHIILSVPHEPYFRIGNLLALSHVKDFGNAPGHINHWNPKSFEKLITPFIKISKIKLSFPWILVYGTVKKN